MKQPQSVKRKWGALGAAAMLLMSIALGACSKEENSGAPEASASASAATAGAENGAPMEITWMPLPSNTQENSYAQQYIEKKFNVKLKTVLSPNTGYVDKQRILLSSHEIPDVFYVGESQDLFKYASQGLLAELPVDAIKQHAPDTYAMLNEVAPQSWYYSNYNGKNYGVPTVYYLGKYNAKQAWREDLLKKAGVDKIPETLEEFEAAFAKLKEIGVYGMSTIGNSYYAQFHTIFGAFGVMPPQWMVKDGKVVNAAIQPEAKEALTLLADWFKKGYIDPEFVTGKDLDVKFVNGKVAFLDSNSTAHISLTNPNSNINKARKIDPNASVVFGPLPKGPGGQHGWAWGTAGHIWAFGKQLKDQPEKTAKILEIINTIQNDEETYLAMTWGVEGKHYELADPSKGPNSGFKRIPPFDDGAKLQTEGLFDTTGLTTVFADQGNPKLFEKFADKEAAALRTLYDGAVSDLFGKPDVLPSSGKYWGDLTKLKVDTYAAIVFGNKPVSAFDDFVKQWNSMGGAELEKEANEMYQAMQKK
ncbi:extracellular solute-binding protein [Paenibacillus sp. YN15]|uniref:extracellular solute-binding protein n=1 Tax=Paenibacillus sp. YN15 TaxID=1742774 RepID=UPI000DCD7279|nr:extracellular solute-binding protein [Paenibacillus sp. YN15]RAV00186.1 hypothetical protein DQG13_14625 [Paenibacillus sp. YN15]